MAKCKIRITCQCGNAWNVDYEEMFTDRGAAMCSKCGASIDTKIWQKKIEPAARACLNCNMEIEKFCHNHPGRSTLQVDILNVTESNNRHIAEACQ